MKKMNKSQKKVGLRLAFLAAILIIVVIDQLIKYYVELFFEVGESVTVIPRVLALTYVQNDGAMLGLMGGKTELMTVLSVICIVLVLGVILFSKIRLDFEFCCIVAIAAGGIGNIIDRVTKGYVVDYIEALFVDFYVFNFADCFITCGVFLIIFYEIYVIIKDIKNKKEKSKNG